jgi:endonuclease/exonuclease/phosphatase (EEP) superfamily protein YafD
LAIGDLNTSALVKKWTGLGCMTAYIQASTKAFGWFDARITGPLLGMFSLPNRYIFRKKTNKNTRAKGLIIKYNILNYGIIS